MTSTAGSPPSATWSVEVCRDRADRLHARPWPEPVRRTVWVLEPVGPALVVGSTQGDEVADAGRLAATGTALVRRRSGGGAVLLDDSAVWIDVVLPAGDRRWEADVGRSFLWLGEVWRRALNALGIDGWVHTGALRRTSWSGLVCFAGLGPGEVSVAGRKAVGLSQRRTRDAARFQSVVYLDPCRGPAGVVDLLAEPEDGTTRSELRRLVAATTTVVPRARGVVVDAFLDALASY